MERKPHSVNDGELEESQSAKGKDVIQGNPVDGFAREESTISH